MMHRITEWILETTEGMKKEAKGVRVATERMQETNKWSLATTERL
jgi:5-hydroxyisourate hydrolase-like protein (transthyretin family)